MFRLRVCFCFCSSSEVGDCHATQGRGMGSPGPSGLTETPREDGDECDGLFLPTDGGWVPQGPVVRRAGLSATPPRQQERQRVVGAQGGAPGARTSATRKETRKGAPRGAPRGRAPRELFVVLDSVLICLSKWSQVDVSFASFFFCFCSSSEVGDGHATQGRGMGSPGPSGLTETPREDGDECDGLFLPTDGGWVPQGPVVRRAGLSATPPRQQERQRVVGAQGGAPGARTSATRKETRKGAPRGVPRGRAPRESCLSCYCF